MKKLLIILYTTLTALLFSQNSLISLNDVQNSELESKGYLINRGEEYKNGLTLIPNDFAMKSDFVSLLNSYNPELFVEMLFVIDKPKGKSGEELTKFLQENILSISEQVGVEYFSDRKKAMTPLITDSYYINNMKDKNKVKDPIITKLIPNREYFLYQKDTTFGGNYYSLSSRTKNGVIWNQMDNLTDLRVLKLFKALDENSLRVSYFIIPNRDKIYLYSLVQIKNPPKIKSILGRDVNIPDSIRKRIESVIKWYLARIN